MSMSLFNKHFNSFNAAFDTMAHEMAQMHRAMAGEMIRAGLPHHGRGAQEKVALPEQPAKAPSGANSIAQWSPFQMDTDPFFARALGDFQGWPETRPVKESDSNYVVSVPIGDIPAGNIKYSYNKDTGVLNVHGETKVEQDGSSYTSSFSRSFTVAPGLALAGAEPVFKDGMMELTVAKPAIEAAPDTPNPKTQQAEQQSSTQSGTIQE